MSYARFGADDSAVYVYADINRYLRCCWCRFGRERHYSTRSMLRHLWWHRLRGDKVPRGTFQELRADRAENDEWLARENQ